MPVEIVVRLPFDEVRKLGGNAALERFRAEAQAIAVSEDSILTGEWEAENRAYGDDTVEYVVRFKVLEKTR